MVGLIASCLSSPIYKPGKELLKYKQKNYTKVMTEILKYKQKTTQK